MRCILVRATLFLSILLPCGVAPGSEAVRVLLIDGQNNHNWRQTTPVLRTMLENAGRFKVSVLTTPPDNTPPDGWRAFQPDFSACDVVLMNYNGQEWPTQAFTKLETFLTNGGGMVAVHAAVASFVHNESFNRMIGMGWREASFGSRLALDASGALVREKPGVGAGAGHGENHSFLMIARQPQHPILKGMPASWTHGPDELYHGMRGPALNVEILATALSPNTKLNEPILWTVSFGKGRVFVTVLGHDPNAMNSPDFPTTLAQGCEWAASAHAPIAASHPASADQSPSKSRLALGGLGPSTRSERATGSDVAASAPVNRAVIERHVDQTVKVYGPYAAVKLPISKGEPLHNPTAICAGPRGKMYAANYTGQIMRLEDSDGDGLEDTAVLIADVKKDGLRYPTGMGCKGSDLYVATTQEIHVYHLGANAMVEQGRTFAKGWPYTMHNYDWTFGISFGGDGALYTILSSDYLNPGPAPDPKALRGSLLRISPDGQTIDKFSDGLRFPYGLAFNSAGDLFFTDNQGGGNPTEELNHAVFGGNYGENPHKAPKSPPRGPILPIKYGAGSGGLRFNPLNNDFGGTAGNAFIAMWGPDGRFEQGSIVRVELAKRADGSYDAKEFRFSDGPAKVIDLSFAPSGDLYVARFGREGGDHTPFGTPEGDVYRFIYTPGLSLASAPPVQAPAPENVPPVQATASVNPPPARIAGDAVNGKRLFTQRNCATCHSVDGSGSLLGPDLGKVGALLDAAGLLESIREPSKSIKTDYQTYQIKTTDGRLLAGRLLSSNAEQVMLFQSNGGPLSIPRAEIKQLKTQPVSLMPEDLLVGMSEAQVGDLIAYLQSLGASERAIRIKAGGGEVTDASGARWLEDRAYSPGGFGYEGGEPYFNNALADPLLRSCRYGSFSYRFDLGNGDYDVTLIFGELYFNEKGQRVFSVRASGSGANAGTAVVSDLDLIQAVGFAKSCQKTVRVKVTDGKLSLAFSASKNEPLVSAIEVRPTPPAAK